MNTPSSGSGTSHCLDDGLSTVEARHEKRRNVRAPGASFKLAKPCRHATTINVLSDDVLLEIFNFCRRIHEDEPHPYWASGRVWKWHILVHVCRRWRHITFASPLRLRLRIVCTYGTPVRKSLDIWPIFPIVIRYHGDEYETFQDLNNSDEDNVIAALEHTSRICEVRLDVTGPGLRRIATMMQEPFPALTYLRLSSEYENVPVLPGQFLGRSAPCLQQLSLDGIPFPKLPILLPFASDLITLTLHNIPQNGYISPEAMVAGLASLPRLRTLSIGFRSPNSRPDQIRVLPTTRSVLPALTSFEFYGVHEYLEDFLARIDVPRLHWIKIRYLNQLVDLEVPHFSRIINHSETFNRPWRCIATIQPHFISFVALPNCPSKYDDPETHVSIQVSIRCQGIDWQVSHLAHLLGQISTVTSNLVHLTLDSGPNFIGRPPDVIDDIEWLQLLSLFPSVRTVSVPESFAGYISRALDYSAGVMSTEVLPVLDILFLKGQSASSVDKFIAARRDSGRPVTIANTEAEFSERQQSYQQETWEGA